MKKIKCLAFDLDDTLQDKSATLQIVAEGQFAQFNLASRGVALSGWAERFATLNNQRIEKAEVFKRLAEAFALPVALA